MKQFEDTYIANSHDKAVGKQHLARLIPSIETDLNKDHEAEKAKRAAAMKIQNPDDLAALAGAVARYNANLDRRDAA